ncbi:MAG: hypothetical protein V9H69_20755 [Anaerolineae bacterium]
MQRKFRFALLSTVLLVLGLLIGPAGAQEAPEGPEVGVCLSGAGYASGCDVDQDGDIDIFDIQRTAGRWNSSGVYTAGHTHWGESWTDASGLHGLRLEHTASSGFTYGLYGQSASSEGIGLVGRTTASTGGMGVYGRSDGAGGYGVYGAAAGSSGENYGVFGYSASSGGYAGYFTGVGADAVRVENGGSGRGVQVHALNDTAVWARTDNGLAGVDGWNSSTTGRGVSGYASAATGATHGVWGQSASTSGTGVLGVATAASGDTTGVYGESASSDGQGVYGKTTASERLHLRPVRRKRQHQRARRLWGGHSQQRDRHRRVRCDRVFQRLCRLFRRSRTRARRLEQVGGLVQDRPPPGPGQPVPLSLLRRIARHEEHLRRCGHVGYPAARPW